MDEAPEKRDDTVYVGKKELMVYVMAVIFRLNEGRDVRIKARGKAISSAVDVTQIVKNKFFKTLQVKSFDVTTEELTGEDGTTRKVSSVLLVVGK
ncbi:DNA-binding protein Alba [Candidatus Micrarchaeota archaeon CG10_big_fil_rev_8_21_14_0_10_59_7]|nr:MAG: DNA-binding protein Alba [Candidatus Micrarchaeota archaeon CG10_big_fil_rev_8_21_14_0_10_59_7]